MLKAIVKFFLNTAIGRKILNDYLDLFLAWILKVLAEKFHRASDLPIVTKIEQGLQELNIEDFMRQKDDAEFRYLASRVIEAKRNRVIASGVRDNKIVI